MKYRITTLATLLLLPLSACDSPRSRQGGLSEDSARRSSMPRPAEPAVSYDGMISSASREASLVGARILKEGGNAIDAAVATGFALAVTYPGAGNIGGGGFMVIRMADGRTTTIDYRERAPGASKRDMFLDSAGNFLPDRSQLGALAAGVPGSPAGLLMALEKYGTMSRAALLAPAIELAEQGFRLDPRLVDDIMVKREEFLRFPSSAKIFADTTKIRGGTIFRQPDLAATLRRIADSGAAGFYGGTTADLIVKEMERSGGIISKQDLLDYRAVERPPVTGGYRGHTIISMPPPSSGGVLLIQMLNMMEERKIGGMEYGSPQHVHLLAEVMKRAYADRAEYLGDPDFVEIPTARLTDRAYARQRASTIGDTATPSSSISHGDAHRFDRESTETTHYSVVDRDGNCVSITTTLNGSFGSKLVVDGAGFLLNNEMDDFSAKPNTPNLYGLVGGEANAILPGKRMLSSMTPTIVIKDGEPVMVVGTPGGSTIITTVLQVISNRIDYGMDLVGAVTARRVHHQWLPDSLYWEGGALAPGTIDSLQARGHHLLPRTGTSGRVDAITIERDGKGRRLYKGWSDLRGYGEAMGPEAVP